MAVATIVFKPNGLDEGLEVKPLSGGTGIFLPRGDVGEFFPVAQLDDEWAESSDTEGGRRMRVKVGNADGAGTVIVSGDDQESFQGYYKEWEMLVADMDEFGGVLEYTPAGGDKITYVIESMKITSAPYDGTKMRAWIQEYAFSFICNPYGHLEEQDLVLADHDAFEYDSVSNADWAVDAGAGTLSAGTGSLVPSSTAVKRYYRAGVEVEDARHVIAVEAKTDVSKGVTGVSKRIDANNALFAVISFNGASSKLLIRKRDGGSDSTLAESGAFTVFKGLTYWIELEQEGSSIVLKVYESEPRLDDEPLVPLAQALHTLSAEDATQFGAGIWGNPGLVLEPASTDYRWYHWSTESTVFRTTKPMQALETPRVPGSASALLDLSLTDLEGKDRRHLEVGMEAGGHSYDTNLAPPALIDSIIMDDASYVGTHETVEGAYGGKAITMTTSDRTLAMIGVQTSHAGPYRIKARMQNNVAQGELVYARVSWRLHDVGYFSEGDWVEVPDTGDSWREIDLGVIEIPTVLEGNQGVTIQVEVYGN